MGSYFAPDGDSHAEKAGVAFTIDFDFHLMGICVGLSMKVMESRLSLNPSVSSKWAAARSMVIGLLLTSS
jgi:hypothetical protein